MSKQKKKDGRAQLGTLISTLIIVAGAVIFAVTGVDLFGVTTPDDPPQAPATLPPVTSAPVTPGAVQPLQVERGIGATKGFWTVWFTVPTESRDRSTYRNGVDEALAATIDDVRSTLDIAAFEFNNERLTEAVIDAHNRGVRVRVVTDNEHGLEDDDSTLLDLEIEGIPIVADTRSALMHNKFLIMDGITVWTGSMNLTVNGVYRNNNNLLALRSRRAVQAYQAEFDEMFGEEAFGPRSPDGNRARFTQDGVPVEIHFAPENAVIDEILAEVEAARSSIRFMAFAFTRDDLGQALLARAAAGVTVEGVFETVGSGTEFSEMTRLFCAGLDVRRDGNPFVLHHKTIIVDDATVITGSFNFSDSAVESNDENLVIIRDPDLAAQYLAEFRRVQSIAAPPPSVECPA